MTVFFKIANHHFLLGLHNLTKCVQFCSVNALHAHIVLNALTHLKLCRPNMLDPNFWSIMQYVLGRSGGGSKHTGVHRNISSILTSALSCVVSKSTICP